MWLLFHKTDGGLKLREPIICTKLVICKASRKTFSMYNSMVAEYNGMVAESEKGSRNRFRGNTLLSCEKHFFIVCYRLKKNVLSVTASCVFNIINVCMLIREILQTCLCLGGWVT